MKEKMAVFPGSLLVVAASLLLSGCCTGIGYVVGEALDNHNAAVDTIQVDNPSIVEVGRPVVVRTKDDIVLSGPLCDIRNARLAEYQAHYAHWQLTHKDRPFPLHLGDTLSIANKRESERHREAVHGIFVGLTITSILLEGFEGEGAPYIEGVKSIPLRSVDRISYGRVRSITGDSICSLVNSRLVPVTTSLAIGVNNDTLLVPWDNVETLRLANTKTPTTGKIIGIVAGAALDITALVITIENISRGRIGGSGWLNPF